jgi:hypothetical protein
MEFGYDPQPIVTPKEMPFDLLKKTIDKPNSRTNLYRSQLKAEWDKIVDKKNIYNVVEIQSDVFQKDLTPLLRSNEMLIENEVKTRANKETILVGSKEELEDEIRKEVKRKIGDQEGYFFRRKYIGSIERIKSTLVRLRPEVSEKNSFVQLYDDVRGEAFEVKQAIISADSPAELYEDVQRLVEIGELVADTRSEIITDEVVKSKLVEYRTEVRKTAEYALKFFENLSNKIGRASCRERV